MARLLASLRVSLPLALLLALLASLAVSFKHQRNAHETAARREAENALQLIAEHLSRTAFWELRSEPARVSAEAALAATDARTASIAVLDARAQIIAADLAQREGRMASGALPGFTEERFLQSQATRQPHRWQASATRIGLAQSFAMPEVAAGEGVVRSLARGVVWIEFDLTHELALARHRAAMEQLPVLVAALLVCGLLFVVLRRQVTQPLAVIGRASDELARSGQLARPVPEVGPSEIRGLARRFNEMARQTQLAREEIVAAQARTSSLVDSAMDAILTVDAERRIVMANRSAMAMFRVTEPELLGQTLEVLLPERYRSRHPELVRRFGESGVTNRQMSAQAVVYGRRWDGEEFPAEASISHSRVGGADFYTVILRDVTERLRNEEAIRALNVSLEATVAERTGELELERARLVRLNAEISLIVDSATVGILLVKDRQVVRCNRMLEQLFGYGPGEAVGRPTRDWYLDEQAYERLGREMMDDLSAGRVHVREQQFVARDGRCFWARISARRFGDESERTILAILEDVTNEHEAADALRAAKAQAESASVAKSRFLANMSHEIRTPMNAIIGMTHLALRTALSDQQRDYLHKIQLSAQHLLGIINDILDFSKVEAGKLSLERIDFQLLPVLDNVFTLIGAKAAEKGLELVLDVAPEVPNFLVGDPLRLGQVLINLGSNAVKFTERGEVLVRVQRLPAEGDVVRLQIEVQDSGVGLSAAQQAQLFQSFHQADASTSRQFGGTGLGLAISQRLVQMMGGEIGVRSEPGRGSTFWFSVELAAGALPEGGPAPRGDPAQLRGRRVLAVDDNESARLVADRLLGSLGLQVATAADGDEAVAAVRAAHAAGQPYDIVLLDWSMPRLDGIEAGRQIRALDLQPPPRLMLITGRGRDEVLREALESGFSTVMVKPINASVLLDNLLLSLSPQAPMLAPTEATARAPRPAQGRALVVEDNAINQQIAQEMLQDLGLTVEIAGNGQEALERLDRSPAFDLVFMDMHMPVMDGIAATRALRQDPRWTRLPVIAMTANVMAEDRERCVAAGMDDFVAKPVDVNALTAAVRRWLPGLAASAAPPSGPVPVANDARLAPLQGIHGLDLRDGLRRCGDRAELYLELLRRFVDSQPATLAELHQVGNGLRGGAGLAPDIEPLRLRVHSLKGVAGNLGATLLHSRCEALERRLREDPLAAAAAIGEVESTTRILGDALRAALGGGVATLSTNAAAGPAAALDLAPLLALLHDGDPDALGWAEQQAAALHQQLGPDATLLLARIRQFDYDQALALLARHRSPETS